MLKHKPSFHIGDTWNC